MTNAALTSGKLLILFDGLDEVPTSNVNNVIHKIGDFVDQYRENRFIASCRIAAYRGGFTRFAEVEMADFDDVQIQTYIKNWFDSTPDEYRRKLHDDMGTANRCWEMLNASEHSATKELARNPLLLTLLCTVYDRSQTLSRNRANLYEKALNLFLEEWAAEKLVHQGASMNQYLDIADEKRMLSEIAAKNFNENRLFFSEDELINQIQEFGAGNANTLETFNARKILETILIDQGLFVERVSRSYSFSHLTFQEYLTANYIVGHPQSIPRLVAEYLHNHQWREVFLLTSGLMHEADDLLMAMEVEAAKLIDTPGLKTLFGWAEQIIDTTDDQYDGVTKRLFVLHQYFSLWLLNKIYEDEEVKMHVQYDLHFYRYFNPNFYLYLGRDSAFYMDLYMSQYLNLNRYPNRYPDFSVYIDLYQYVTPYFYPIFSAASGDQFDEELQGRIRRVKHIEEVKIFKEVDLQRVVQRFNAQRKYIKAAREGKSVEPPAESIHDTWFSVLGITSEMLTISYEELENFLRYLHGMDLIVACKETAGRVSRDKWQEIEDRFLTVDAANLKN